MAPCWLYLQDFPLVEVQHLLLEAIVADRLHADQPQDLEERVLLGNAVLNIRVDLLRVSRKPL